MDGNPDKSSGLLIADNGNTAGTVSVCSSLRYFPYFSNDSARVMCLDMGFEGLESWNRTGNNSLWDLNHIQKKYPIVLTEMECENQHTTYKECVFGLRTAEFDEYCDHSTDIVITCQNFTCSLNTYYNNKLGECVTCPSDSTSKPNSLFCDCPPNYFWNSDYHDCIKCPDDSSSLPGLRQCYP